MDSMLAKDVTQEYTSSYAKYVATNRAIPSLVDGLKPVNRRCINSADDLRLYHDKKFLKVAKLEGQVMGDYHPHGGASPVLLAQPFKTRYPLFEGQGNFGSPDDPDSVAASRYIECRLTKFCEDFYLSSSDYADKSLNYDGRLQEITQYYPPIPGSLLTGASGIAVGLSTNIPTHTIKDVCQSLLSYIDYPDNEDYIKMMTPETCEESIILTPKSDIMNLYRTGEGSIQYKAKTHYENIEGKLALIVDSFPPDYSKKRLDTASIIEAVEFGELELRNESKESIRYVFLSNDKSILKSVENRLISTSSYRMYIEHKGRIKCYSLSELYDDFLESRIDYIMRKYQDLKSRTEDEIEFIDVLLKFKNDKDYIRSMFDKSQKEVVLDIQERYNTTPAIATRIISSTLSSMMKDNLDKLNQKLHNLYKRLDEYTTYISNPMCKIKLDIHSLLDEYDKEKKRATHIDDIENTITIHYNEEIIRALPDSVFYVASHDNTYTKMYATDLLSLDLSDKLVVSADYKYYVFYDKCGLIAVTSDIMERLESKFKSSTLIGLIGTNDLSSISFKRSTNKLITLDTWALRTRLSYIRQVDDGDHIEIIAQS